MSFANPFEHGHIAVGDPMEMMKHMLQQDPKPMELIICGKCEILNTWLTIRKILDHRGNLVEYRCMKCATEGGKSE